eukprot:117923-Rhodomonas_salina.2
MIRTDECDAATRRHLLPSLSLSPSLPPSLPQSVPPCLPSHHPSLRLSLPRSLPPLAPSLSRSSKGRVFFFRYHSSASLLPLSSYRYPPTAILLPLSSYRSATLLTSYHWLLPLSCYCYVATATAVLLPLSSYRYPPTAILLPLSSYRCPPLRELASAATAIVPISSYHTVSCYSYSPTRPVLSSRMLLLHTHHCSAAHARY